VIEREQLVFAAICDLAGQVRGKAFPLADLASRMRAGVGYTHSNIMMSAFGPIYETPFGTAGDLMLVPDPDARVEVAFAEGDVERFYLSDLRTTDGGYWECCPRDFLRRGLAALEHETGLTLTAAFEQEFVYTGVADRPSSTYGLDLFRRQGAMGEILLGALRQAGVTPDSFMAEYGPRQFEVTVAPKPGLRAADEAVIVREMARATAHRLGHWAIMAPMPAPDGTGSGTHIHFSLQDARGRPAMPEPGAALSPDTEPLGADLGRVTGAGPWLGAADLPGVRGGVGGRRGREVQRRVSRGRRRRQPVHGTGRARPRRARRHPPQAAAAVTAARRFLDARRCRQGRRRGAGVAGHPGCRVGRAGGERGRAWLARRHAAPRLFAPEARRDRCPEWNDTG